MADSPEEERDSASPSPRKEQSRSLSRSIPRARSTSRSLPRPRVRSENENPGTTLYVAGLSTKVTDKDPEAHFSKEGKVASCSIVMNRRTRVSCGFAFVTMDSLTDAERCIKNLNKSLLEGGYITVEKSRRTRPKTPTRGHNLGLKSSRDTINGGVSKDLPSSSPRKEQHRSLSGSMPRERSRSRSLSRPISPSRTRGRSENENPGTTLYVAGLSTKVTDKDLEAHFSKEGKVVSCFLVLDPRTRVSCGFAFVTMDSLKDAERCIKNLNKSLLEGGYITVEKSRRKHPRTPIRGHNLGMKSSRDTINGGVSKDLPSLSRPISPSRTRGRSESENPGTTLFVAGLSTKVTNKDLEEHFSREGKVASCVLVVNPYTRESRGFAFVTMDSLTDAERCIKNLNKSFLEGRRISVRSRRKSQRTRTPGLYLSLRSSRDNWWCFEVRSLKNSPYPSPRKEQSRSLSRSMLRERSRSRSLPRPRVRRSPRRNHSPRDGRRSPRRGHSPRDGRRSPRRDHSPRDRRRSPRQNHSPRDVRRPPRRDHSPRDRRRSPRRNHSPRDVRRSPRRGHSPRDGKRSPRLDHSPRDGRRRDRRSERRYQPCGSR